MQPALQLNPDEWGNRNWRLHNLYWITNKAGKRVLFRPNSGQLQLLDELWYLNIVLKSRQRGFSTFIDILGLDLAVFARDQNVGIIAHGLREATAIFESKIKFPYENLPAGLTEIVHPVKEQSAELELANGSRVVVGTSMRSGTFQFLHVTEFGKISVKYPERAKEIVTGSFNAVAPGQYIFVESTAEGRDGYFYKMCQVAEKKKLSGEPLTLLDFRFHFFPWWTDADNVLEHWQGVPIPGTYATYFEELAELGIKLTPAQKAWYVKKAENQEKDMKAEYPATPVEAFEGAIEGAVYGKQMQWLRAHRHIRKVDFVRTEPVNTFWDLGRNDCNGIWLHQYIAGEHRFPYYFENRLEDLAYYVRELEKLSDRHRFMWGRHFLPHDGQNQNLERSESRVDRLDELGFPKRKIVVVPRIPEIGTGIEQTRKILPLCWFDLENTDVGVKGLESYQYEYDEKTGTFKTRPLHNWASTAADALRQFGQGWTPPKAEFKPTVRPRRPLDAGMGY